MRRQVAAHLLAALLLAAIVAPAPALAEPVRGPQAETDVRGAFLDRVVDTFWGWIQAIWDEEKGQIVP
jgi:hypothetical protein